MPVVRLFRVKVLPLVNIISNLSVEISEGFLKGAEDTVIKIVLPNRSIKCYNTKL